MIRLKIRQSLEVFPENYRPDEVSDPRTRNRGQNREPRIRVARVGGHEKPTGFRPDAPGATPPRPARGWLVSQTAPLPAANQLLNVFPILGDPLGAGTPPTASTPHGKK